MEYMVEEILYKSSNKIDNIYALVMSPIEVSKIKGVLQFSHGMCEYVGKYEEFFKFMVANGFVVCSNDNLGHGKSVADDKDLGFFAEKDGNKYLVEDAYMMTKLIKKRYPYLPIFLMGHSMGSLIVRNYAMKYGDKINGLILCATVGPQWMIDTGIQMADMLIQRKGLRYRSRKLDQLAFGVANIEFEPVTSRYDWICSDEEVVKEHENDEKNTFIFTTSAFKDMFYMIKFCNDEKTVKTTPKDLPIYIFSGSKDSIGDNGEGVKKVYNLYKKIGVKEVTIKLYDGCRHEMLNEKNKIIVYNDVLDWIELIRFGEE